MLLVINASEGCQLCKLDSTFFVLLIRVSYINLKKNNSNFAAVLSNEYFLYNVIFYHLIQGQELGL